MAVSTVDVLRSFSWEDLEPLSCEGRRGILCRLPVPFIRKVFPLSLSNLELFQTMGWGCGYLSASGREQMMTLFPPSSETIFFLKKKDWLKTYIHFLQDEELLMALPPSRDHLNLFENPFTRMKIYYVWGKHHNLSFPLWTGEEKDHVPRT